MKKIILLVCALSSMGFASNIEVVWRRIDTHYFYKDASLECSTKASISKNHLAGQAFLSLEVESERVLAGRISNYPNTPGYKYIYQAIDLNSAELAAIQVVRDKKKQLWVKSFDLTERLAKWLIYFPTQRHSWCKVPFLPSRLNPSSQKVNFETEGIELGVETSYSDWISLDGNLSNGKGFQEMLRLILRKAN